MAKKYLDNTTARHIMKPTEKQIHIYCSLEVFAKLKALAESDNRTLSYQIVLLINKAHAEFIRESKDNLKG